MNKDLWLVSIIFSVKELSWPYSRPQAIILDWFSMRLVFSLIWLIFVTAANAQSVTDNLPPMIIEGQPFPEGEPVVKELPSNPAASSDLYTVTGINADATGETAAKARDIALMQAQRTAYSELCTRLNIADNAGKLSDDALASLVQSFEVQSERVSSVRYIGVYTIHFKPSAIQKKMGVPAQGEEFLPQGPVTHLIVDLQADSLGALAQTKKRLGKVHQVARIDTLSLGKTASRIDVSYSGSFENFIQGLAMQGLMLVKDVNGFWTLADTEVTPL